MDAGVDYMINLNLFDHAEPEDISENIFRGTARKIYQHGPIFQMEVKIEEDMSITVSVSGDETRGMPPGKYNYDIVMWTPNGVSKKIREGLIFMSSTITETEPETEEEEPDEIE